MTGPHSDHIYDAFVCAPKTEYGGKYYPGQKYYAYVSIPDHEIEVHIMAFPQPSFILRDVLRKDMVLAWLAERFPASRLCMIDGIEVEPDFHSMTWGIGLEMHIPPRPRRITRVPDYPFSTRYLSEISNGI
jgi:hypothetical protein